MKSKTTLEVLISLFFFQLIIAFALTLLFNRVFSSPYMNRPAYYGATATETVRRFAPEEKDELSDEGEYRVESISYIGRSYTRLPDGYLIHDDYLNNEKELTRVRLSYSKEIFLGFDGETAPNFLPEIDENFPIFSFEGDPDRHFIFYDYRNYSASGRQHNGIYYQGVSLPEFRLENVDSCRIEIYRAHDVEHFDPSDFQLDYVNTFTDPDQLKSFFELFDKAVDGGRGVSEREILDVFGVKGWSGDESFSRIFFNFKNSILSYDPLYY